MVQFYLLPSPGLPPGIHRNSVPDPRAIHGKVLARLPCSSRFVVSPTPGHPLPIMPDPRAFTFKDLDFFSGWILKRRRILWNFLKYFLSPDSLVTQRVKNKLRTFQPRNRRNSKNSQPQNKFTGSYKKRVYS